MVLPTSGCFLCSVQSRVSCRLAVPSGEGQAECTLSQQLLMSKPDPPRPPPDEDQVSGLSPLALRHPPHTRAGDASTSGDVGTQSLPLDPFSPPWGF